MDCTLRGSSETSAGGGGRSRERPRRRAGAVPASGSAPGNHHDSYKRARTGPGGPRPPGPRHRWVEGPGVELGTVARGPAAGPPSKSRPTVRAWSGSAARMPLQTKRHHVPLELAQLRPKARLPPIRGPHLQLVSAAGQIEHGEEPRPPRAVRVEKMCGSGSTAGRVMAFRAFRPRMPR